MDTEATSEVMYSTADVAKRLKVGSAMVRKWAIAYENITDDKIKLKSKRDGREFTAGQVDIISAAKSIVDSEGVKVDAALKAVLGQSSLISAVPVGELESKDTLRLVEAILERNDKTNQLLLEEIKGLRADLASNKELPVPEIKKSKNGAAEDKQYGMLVRAALWLESVLRR